jgi:hypothetical protein
VGNDSESTADATGVALNWRLAVYGGGLLGGVIWGLVALFTVGAVGNQAQHDAVDGGRLLLSAAVCAVMGIVGVCLLRFGRGRSLRGIGVALIAGPTGGWLIVASLAIQSCILGGR